jgi:hypothetical protein
MKRPNEQAGLLLAMMEPSPAFESEFQDWYDLEHFPERAAIDGFLTATRLICIDGWPRYLTLYDLADVDVLRGEAYGRIAGENYSRWTHRVVPRLWGQYRAESVQVYPGKALLEEKGRFSRVMLWRFRDVPPVAGAEIVQGLRTIYEGRPETAQVRVFTSRQKDATDHIGLVELHAPYSPPPEAVEALGAGVRHLDMVNSYTRYNRS